MSIPRVETQGRSAHVPLSLGSFGNASPTLTFAARKSRSDRVGMNEWLFMNERTHNAHNKHVGGSAGVLGLDLPGPVLREIRVYTGWQLRPRHTDRAIAFCLALACSTFATNARRRLRPC